MGSNSKLGAGGLQREKLILSSWGNTMLHTIPKRGLSRPFLPITVCLLAIASLLWCVRVWPELSPLRFSWWKLWACAASWLGMFAYLCRTHLVRTGRGSRLVRAGMAALALLLAVFAPYVAWFEGLWGLVRGLWQRDLPALVAPTFFLILGWKLMKTATTMTYDTWQVETESGARPFPFNPLIQRGHNVLRRSGHLRGESSPNPYEAPACQVADDPQRGRGNAS